VGKQKMATKYWWSPVYTNFTAWTSMVKEKKTAFVDSFCVRPGRATPLVGKMIQYITSISVFYHTSMEWVTPLHIKQLKNDPIVAFLQVGLDDPLLFLH
jgi:hypothetical protein